MSKKTMKRASFKMGDEVTDGVHKFIYLFRSTNANKNEAVTNVGLSDSYF